MLGGGVTILDAAIDRVERSGEDGLTVHVRRTDRDEALAIEVDEVIAATGFTTPLQDLPALGCAVAGQSRLPVQTPWWESATLPGVFFAGTITQGARGLRRHGVPSNSGAVHGARYNARVLARPHRPDPVRHASRAARCSPRAAAIDHIAPGADRVARSCSTSAATWHGCSLPDGSGGLRDDGTQPLAHALDSADRRFALAVTLEADGSGAIYPVLYARRGGTTIGATCWNPT